MIEWKTHQPVNQYQGFNYQIGTFLYEKRGTIYKCGNVGMEAVVTLKKYERPQRRKTFLFNDTEQTLLKLGHQKTVSIDFVTEEMAKRWVEEMIVLNTPDEDLPLLIGQLFYTTSKKFLERRLCNG